MLLMSMAVIILYFSLKSKHKTMNYLGIIAIASIIQSLTSDFTYLLKTPIVSAFSIFTAI
jgi:hypothetical protein